MATPRIVAGRYEVLREIARGGMAVVYEAMHVVSRRRVALKVLFSASFADDMSRARFLREVSAPARIGHEGIVEVFDAGFDDGDGAPFVAMELLQGHTFRSEFEDGLSLQRVVTLFQGLLAPMAAAHSVHVVHRDLKPENVFVTRRGAMELVKILDFGLARTVDERAEKETRTGVAMGTPHYMAPEQAVSARDVTPAADVWAIGVMLYEALGGTTPFSGPTPSAIVVEAVTQPHVPLGQRKPQTPAPLAALVDRCLEKEPTRRPPNAGALLDELNRLQGTLGENARSGPAPTAAGQASLARGASAEERSVPPTAAMAVTPPPFDSPLVTGAPGPRPATSASSSGAASPSPRVNPAPLPGATPAPADAGKPTREAPIGLALGAGLGLLLLLLAAATGGGAYLLTRNSSEAEPAPLEGDLAPGDATLRSGEYVDGYDFDWPAGTRVHVEMRSAQFDPYLIVKPPAGRQLDNDDATPGDTAASLDFTASPGGRWRVVATSHHPGEVGHYRLFIKTGTGM